MSNELFYIHKLQRCLAKMRKENSELKESFRIYREQNDNKVRGLENALREERRERQYYYRKGLHPDQYESELKEWYFQRTGQRLDLDNPVTYNEKIQWLKLHDSTQLKADLTDKYKVREYVRGKIGEQYLIPLLGAWDEPDDILFDTLPEQFVLKANHGCGYNIIVTDKSKLNIPAAKAKLKYWLSIDYAFVGGFELHYSKIQRKIIAEQYIENLDGDVLDYKVFCFDGKAKYIMVITERKKKPKMFFYDTLWNRIELTHFPFEPGENNIAQPRNLNELINAAEVLAKGFCQVRVDFYILNNGDIKFGEMTFTAASGACRWEPPVYDKIFGDLIHLENIAKRGD